MRGGHVHIFKNQCTHSPDEPYLFNNAYNVRPVSHGYVQTAHSLIIETLHKLLRYDEIPRFLHEMGERLTQFTADQLKEAVLFALPKAALEILERTSEGFRKAYIEGNVRIHTPKTRQECHMPFSHVQVTAVSLADTPGISKTSQQDPKNPDVGRYKEQAPIPKESLTQPRQAGSGELPGIQKYVDEVRAKLSEISRPFLELFDKAIFTSQQAFSKAEDANSMAASAREAIISQHPKYLDIKPKGSKPIPFSKKRRRKKPVFFKTALSEIFQWFCCRVGETGLGKKMALRGR